MFRLAMEDNPGAQRFLEIWKKNADFLKTAQGKRISGTFYSNVDVLLLDADLSSASEHKPHPVERLTKFDNFKKDQFLEMKYIIDQRN